MILNRTPFFQLNLILIAVRSIYLRRRISNHRMRLTYVRFAFFFLLSAGFTSCQKEFVLSPVSNPPITDTVSAGGTVLPDSTTGTDTAATGTNNAFTTYTILQGEQYCVGNAYPVYVTSAMYFTVKFDSSDIYTSQLASNQYDYNKLYGFSDNMSDHHSFSARFGWRWCNNHIELSAYTYNDGVRSIKDLGGIDLNKEHNCAIMVSGSQYDFVLDGDTTSVPRTSTTAQAMGYKLLPYFGGDEVAPHTMTIQIREN